MNKRRFKQATWPLLAVVVLILGAVALRGLGEVAAYFQIGADPASALKVAPPAAEDRPVVNWWADAPDTGRTMEPQTRRDIAAAYTRAWRALNAAYATGDTADLSSYFAGPALQAVSDNVQVMAAQPGRITQGDIRHTLALHFYAADGSIVSFTDHDAHITHEIRDVAGQVVAIEARLATYDVVMFLEDGNWRVRHWVRGADGPAPNPPPYP